MLSVLIFLLGAPGEPPYARSEAIIGIEFDFASHRRLASGSDNWPMTWADDGHQYTAWGDGGGFGGSNSCVVLRHPEEVDGGSAAVPA